MAVGHPVYYTGIDYIYEDRGEVSFFNLLYSSFHFHVPLRDKSLTLKTYNSFTDFGCSRVWNWWICTGNIHFFFCVCLLTFRIKTILIVSTENKFLYNFATICLCFMVILVLAGIWVWIDICTEIVFRFLVKVKSKVRWIFFPISC